MQEIFLQYLCKLNKSVSTLIIFIPKARHDRSYDICNDRCCVYILLSDVVESYSRNRSGTHCALFLITNSWPNMSICSNDIMLIFIIRL